MYIVHFNLSLHWTSFTFVASIICPVWILKVYSTFLGFKPVQSKGLSTGDESEMLLEEDEAEGEEKVFSLTGLTLFLTTVSSINYY